MTSGIRLGTPASTTRGFGPEQFRKVAQLILAVLDGLKVCHHQGPVVVKCETTSQANGEAGNAEVEAAVKREVAELCKLFPVY